MLYVATEIILFLLGAFVLGWWFGHQRQRPEENTANEAVNEPCSS